MLPLQIHKKLFTCYILKFVGTLIAKLYFCQSISTVLNTNLGFNAKYSANEVKIKKKMKMKLIESKNSLKDHP